MFSITTERIEEWPKMLAGSRSGARIVFEGVVRDNNEGQAVESLEYEAMEPLACKEGSRILEEARSRYPLLDVECVHRIGHLQVGDLAIRVTVVAGHRREAFEACQYIVDEVKSRVPIWKKEHYATGKAGWINSEP